jgi:hypothetical protein
MPKENDMAVSPAHNPTAMDIITTWLRTLFLQIFLQAINTNMTQLFMA